MKRFLRRFLLIAFSLSLTALSTMAQTTTGSIVGLVTDTTSSAVPNASVTVTRVDTGIATKTTTNMSGNYVVTPLQTGTYSVSVEAQGFKKSVSAGITLNVQDRLAVNVVLEVGQITETVEVQGATPPLQTDT